MDPSFDPRKDLEFRAHGAEMGTVPLACLEQFRKADFTYGYVGREDLTM